MTANNILTGINTNTLKKREIFIHATIDCLIDHGYAGTTVRKIAKYAEVTPGLLTHYFKGKDALIAETYSYVSRNFMDNISEKVDLKADDPIEALRTYLTSRIETESSNPKLLKVWLTFWTMTLTQSDLQHIHKELNHEYIKALKQLLTRAYEASEKPIDPKELHNLAIGIHALLDGLWLEWCLDPTPFFAEEGLSIITQYIEGVSGLIIHRKV